MDERITLRIDKPNLLELLFTQLLSKVSLQGSLELTIAAAVDSDLRILQETLIMPQKEFSEEAIERIVTAA